MLIEQRGIMKWNYTCSQRNEYKQVKENRKKGNRMSTFDRGKNIIQINKEVDFCIKRRRSTTNEREKKIPRLLILHAEGA